MRTMSKRFKRRIVSFATALVTLITYIPFMNTRWAIYLAMCIGYTVAVFGLAWSDGKMSRFFSVRNRSVGSVLQIHFVFILLLVLWIWLAQFARPWLPTWVVAEGDHHESWLLVFALLGIVGMLLLEHWWFSKVPERRDLEVRESS